MGDQGGIGRAGHARVEGPVRPATGLPALRSTNGWITDKPEDLAVTRAGEVLVVTDNDAVDGWSGETQLLDLGRLHRLFRRDRPAVASR